MSLSAPSSAFDSETFGQDASFHLEQPVGSMTISPSGRDVALASKEGLHIIDLDSPYSPPRYLPHRTPWEVADVQWSPFALRDYWVVSTSNQKALVWNLGAKSWQDTIELVLHAHTRAITDINFSAHDPDMLATCAVDSFVHCWDLRAPLRPAFSFSDWFAGATQVKWSRKDEHVLASSHDKFLHIWDRRQGAIPMRTIEAHGTKIYGVDWNRFEPHKVVTCSLDRTIKFWNTKVSDDEPERVIETPFPVWRARHTPFGWGMVAMPQRGSSELYLYDRRPIDGYLESGHVRPVARFPGHGGQVKEFLWRARGSVDEIDHRDFQLISWGTDKELRLHRIEPEVLEGIGYEKGISKTHRLNFTRKGARYRTFRDNPDDVSSPIEPPTRGDSLPSQQQIFSFRKRTSTAVGMSKVPVSQIRGWGKDGRRTSRIAMHGRGNTQNEINPIAWLKNVKIATWDPDALAEEIRHVGEKFKKVEFETVDIKHRKLVMSLQAPWKEHETSIYLRVDIRFPKAYPRDANAIIAVQKTGAIENELHATLTKELHSIAEVYAAQKRGCLEAVLRYVLREQSLEQIVTWVMGESVVDSKIIEPEMLLDDDSSDSDDDNLQGLGHALTSSANVRVPLAKGCGALWSETGTLVCFFPPKSKEPDSVFGALSVQNVENSESGRLFEGFGRWHPSSPSRKATNGTKTADDDSDSDSMDSLLDSSSSSSSSSSEPGTDLQGSILPYHKAVSGLALQRSRSLDYSNRSTTMAGAKMTEGPRKSVLSLHRYDDLIPSTKELAQEYRIFGAGQDVCTHNAEAAGKCGRDDLHSVWTLAGMVLSRNVPLEMVENPADDSKEDILVIARQATSRLKRTDSGIDLGNDVAKKASQKVGLAQLRWGTSPLAATYLVPAMFDYFDRIGDIQMLAMLSCIFANVSVSSSAHGVVALSSNATIDSSPLGRQYYRSKSVAEALLRPQPEADYVWVPPGSQIRGARLLSSSDEQAVLHSRRAATVSREPLGGYRYEADGRKLSRTPSVVGEDSHSSSRSAAVSLSTSPEGNRLTHRASASGNLSNAQASLSALSQTFSHSPPTQGGMSGVASSLKKYSPSSSLTPSWGIFSGGHGTRGQRPSVHYAESFSHDKETGLRSSASLLNIRSLRRDGRLTPDTSRQSVRSIAPSEASDSTRKLDPKKRKKTLKTKLRNQDRFDLDSYVSVPLLDPHLEERYKGYRTSYAHLLDVWELHIPRAEVLKIDGVANDEGSDPSPIKRPRRKTLVFDGESETSGLQVRRLCQNCGNVLAAIEKNGVAIGWHCVKTDCASSVASKTISRKSRCAVCEKAVNGLSVPCLQCGHLTCYDCAEEWFANRHVDTEHQQKRARAPSKESVALETVESGEEAVIDEEVDEEYRTCPSGCGCPCANVDVIVLMPATSNRNSREISQPRPLQRTASQISTTSQTSTLMSHNTTDTALASFLALTRKKSTSGDPMAVKTGPVVESSPPKAGPSAVETSTDGEAGGESDHDGDKLLNPWATSKIASLGRGLGGGLSRGLRERGLRERGSDSTIRRVG